MSKNNGVVGSSALEQADYWWFKGRAILFEKFFGQELETGSTILDIGSSNSPSVQWMKNYGDYTPMDLDERGLPENGIVGSITDIPLDEDSIDYASAFDVIEHIADDSKAVSEIHRVLKPGGKLFVSVPAYEWAWSNNDVQNDHYRRYTRRSMTRLLKANGFQVKRASYAFTTVFPFFMANLVMSWIKETIKPSPPPEKSDIHKLEPLPGFIEKILLNLTKIDAKVLKKRNLPFGSSILVIAVKPDE